MTSSGKNWRLIGASMTLCRLLKDGGWSGGREGEGWVGDALASVVDGSGSIRFLPWYSGIF
jgi:hypothetical protein